MSNLVVNKLSEFLSKVIKNYSKDVLNVSLLKGEIHLKDFEVDVNVINIYVEHYVPFLHVTKATVSDVKLCLPAIIHLSSKPTIIEIGHVEIECIQRDFSKPSAKELIGDDDFFLTASATADDKDNYGLIKKVIDGCRVEIDCIHLKCVLNGLPSPKDKSGPKLHSNWFAKNVDPSNYTGKPLILDVLLQNCVFQQTNQSFKVSQDLKYLRKSQGDRIKDFCVYKMFTSKSFNVTLMPWPHTHSHSHSHSHSDTDSDAVILLQNASLNLKFIFQRKASDGTLKTISIECFFDKLEIFMTQSQYFDLNYWIASLLYAQARQYAFENPHLSKDFEPSQSHSCNSYSITAQSSRSQTQTSNINVNVKHESKCKDLDDEDQNAKESQHLSAGKLLFDALSLCQPPRFQWNKIPVYTTIGLRVDRFLVHIMPSDWTCSSHYYRASAPKSKSSKVKSKGKGKGKAAKSSQSLIKGVGNVAKDIGSIGAKGIGSMAKGMKKAVTATAKKKTISKPPPPPPAMSKTLTESRIGDIDKEFLLACHLMPKHAITKMSVGDEFVYEYGALPLQKPLVMAILSDFSLGMIFPDLGHSIWRTRIGKARAEQFFSVQVADLDVLADTQLKDQLQDQLKTGFTAAVSQLRAEQQRIDQEKEKEFTPEPVAVTATAKGKRNGDDSKSEPEPQKKTLLSTKCMTLIVSSRHYKTHTITSNKHYFFTVSKPLKGYNPDTMSVFNYQWTRRIPAPSSVLAQMTDMHIKPLCIYLDPFLVFNCLKLFAGNGVIRVYRMQAALSSFTVVFERFASRYLLDAVKIIIPINDSSRVSASIHNLRLSSHDKLDQTVHERGLVDLSNFSSVGKHSLHAMGLGTSTINKIQRTKEEYVNKIRETELNGAHFSSSYDNRLKASMAPNVSAILRPPDEYPWEVNIGHFSLASVVTLEDNRYDNEFQFLNCRMRYVMIRSDEDDINICKPFIETQLSFRTDSVEGSIDTTVLDQVMNKIDFGGIADLPLPALFNKIKKKMREKQQRREMERKVKKDMRFGSGSDCQLRQEEKKEEKRLKKQQKRRQKRLKKHKSSLDVKLVAKDVLLNSGNGKHSDVREIQLSDSEQSGSEQGLGDDDNLLDLDSFIEGVLDGIGGHDNDDEEEEEASLNTLNADHTPVTPLPIPNCNTNMNMNMDMNLESDSESSSFKKRKKKEEMEYRLIVFSNLDRGEFQITNNGQTQLKGKTRSQQLLLQWTQEVLNFHFFSTELKLYESPIGKYQEHDVVTRFSRSSDGRMWSEVVHDEPDGAIELTYPPSLQRIVDKIEEKEQEKDKDKNELVDLVKYISLENRVMQTRVLQLASDLSVSRDDMKRFVKQTSEDKIRIVEHQQYLINDNMELQKQVQALKKRIRELELARNYVKK